MDDQQRLRLLTEAIEAGLAKGYRLGTGEMGIEEVGGTYRAEKRNRLCPLGMLVVDKPVPPELLAEDSQYDYAAQLLETDADGVQDFYSAYDRIVFASPQHEDMALLGRHIRQIYGPKEITA